MKILNSGVRSLFFILCLSLTEARAFENVSAVENADSKYKVLVFLSKSCPCSRSHVEHLNKLAGKYSDVSFFGVVTDIFDTNSEKEIRDYYNEKNFQFALIKDTEQKLVKKYKALKTPHSIILSREKKGNYQLVYQGGTTNSREFSTSTKKFLGENLKTIHQGKPIKYAVGKSLGCYIRRL